MTFWEEVVEFIETIEEDINPWAFRIFTGGIVAVFLVLLWLFILAWKEFIFLAILCAIILGLGGIVQWLVRKNKKRKEKH